MTSIHDELEKQDAAVVHSAAQFMDEQYPVWVRNINISDLRMVDPDRCVAGQNDLDWKKLAREFCEWATIDIDEALNAFANRGDLWIFEIQARRGVSGDS